jgi:hypothetical protein
MIVLGSNRLLELELEPWWLAGTFLCRRSWECSRLSGITHRIPYPERAFYGRPGSMRANLSSTWATAATDVAVEIGFSGIWRLLPDDNSHDKRRLPLHFLDFR